MILEQRGGGCLSGAAGGVGVSGVDGGEGVSVLVGAGVSGFLGRSSSPSP